jgi:hypothetical protein
VNTGINETVSVPSANSRLSKFGILKATQNASVTCPAPKRDVITISRISPSILLKKVKILTDLADFAIVDLSFMLQTIFV